MIGKLIILCIGLVALWAGANRIGRVLGLKSFMKVKVEKQKTIKSNLTDISENTNNQKQTLNYIK